MSWPPRCGGYSGTERVMSPRQASPEVNVRTLLESGRELPRVPDTVRKRVLARVRFTAAFPVRLDRPAEGPRLRWGQVLASAVSAVMASVFLALVAVRSRLTSVARHAMSAFGWHFPRRALRRQLEVVRTEPE
jgi:hypothetical protein